jgi:hypothetical protein
MTRTPEILGSEYDAPAKLPERLAHYEKRGIALAELERAEANGDSTTAELMYWELGLLDLLLSPPKDVSPYHRGPTRFTLNITDSQTTRWPMLESEPTKRVISSSSFIT